MAEDPLYMIPGPVPLSDGVRRAMSQEIISHRSPEFEQLYRDCQAILQDILGTTEEVVFVNGSGTAAMETAVGSTVSPDDTVLCIINGKFGERFKLITERYTSKIQTVEVEWGSPIPLDAVRAQLGDVSVVTMVHVDTSAGVVNPVSEVGAELADTDTTFIVDCVTSACSAPIHMDEWGIDLAVTASQKAIAGPPGLSAVAVTESMQEELSPSNGPYYLDLPAHVARAETYQTPTTSHLHAFYGLHQALEEVSDEGIDSRIDSLRHRSRAMRESMNAVGLQTYPIGVDSSALASNAVTIVDLPSEIDTDRIVRDMRERGVHLRTGLGVMADHTIRFGVMGQLSNADIYRAIETFTTALTNQSFSPAGNGVEAARRVLTE